METDDIDLARAFDRHVVPELTRLEQHRLEAVAESAKRKWPAIFGTAFGAAIGGAIGSFFDSGFVGFIFLGFIFGLGLAVWAGSPLGTFEGHQRQAVMDAICTHVGEISYSRSVTDSGFDVSAFEKAHVVPDHSSATFEDLLRGTHRGCSFDLVEATLRKRGSSNKTRTVFEGLLVRISLPRALTSGPVIIAADRGQWLGFFNTVSGWMTPGSRVAIPHDAFEERYEVYAENAREALELINPRFVENFLKLPDVLGTKKILAAFHGSAFLISAEGTDAFLDDFSADVTMAELRTLFARTHHETRLIHRIVDQLLEGDRYA
ncbi:MAG: DUF3137 domain-containing protein [Pseudomonadota bacterium]